MTKIDKYCPKCRSQVSKYLGRDSQPETTTTYMCHICDRSYCFEELVDSSLRDETPQPKRTLTDKLLGLNHDDDGGSAA